MRYRRRKLYVSHTFTSYLSLCYLYSALIANYSLISYSLVLSAMAFPVLCRSENPLAVKTVLFRLECSVIYGFRLCNLTVRPAQDLFRRCQPDLKGFKIIQLIIVIIVHLATSPFYNSSLGSDVIFPASSSVSSVSSDSSTS